MEPRRMSLMQIKVKNRARLRILGVCLEIKKMKSQFRRRRRNANPRFPGKLLGPTYNMENLTKRKGERTRIDDHPLS